MEEPHLAEGKLGGFMAFADELRSMKVLANADSATDARTARRNGAEGIGLCRTEHMVCTSGVTRWHAVRIGEARIPPSLTLDVGGGLIRTVLLASGAAHADAEVIQKPPYARLECTHVWTTRPLVSIFALRHAG